MAASCQVLDGTIEVDPETGKWIVGTRSQPQPRRRERSGSKQKSSVVNAPDVLPPFTPITANNVRVVCISDTHSHLDEVGHKFIPDGDILLHSGDITNDGDVTELYAFNKFIGKLPHKFKVVIAGNHDYSLDNEHRGKKLKWREMLGISRATSDCLTNCIYLQDSMVDIYGIKIYGCPWFPGTQGAFVRSDRQEISRKWEQIPLDTNILMTHAPPLGHCDAPPIFAWIPMGYPELRDAVERVCPQYHVFGHIHEGYGMTTNGKTFFINAAMCDRSYKPVNTPIVFDFPLPPGRTKHSISTPVPYSPTEPTKSFLTRFSESWL